MDMLAIWAMFAIIDNWILQTEGKKYYNTWVQCNVKFLFLIEYHRAEQSLFLKPNYHAVNFGSDPVYVFFA